LFLCPHKRDFLDSAAPFGDIFVEIRGNHLLTKLHKIEVLDVFDPLKELSDRDADSYVALS